VADYKRLLRTKFVKLN